MDSRDQKVVAEGESADETEAVGAVGESKKSKSTKMLMISGSLIAALVVMGGVMSQNIWPFGSDIAYKPTGAPRTRTLSEDVVMCADPQDIVRVTHHQRKNGGALGQIPDDCAITTKEYDIAVVKQIEVDNVEIAQIEFSDDQAKPAFVRVSRQADERESASSSSGSYTIRAGSLLCNSAHSMTNAAAILYAQPNNPYLEFRGCSRIGSAIQVTLLGPSTSAFYQELVLVGNQGGSGWVRRQDMD